MIENALKKYIFVIGRSWSSATNALKSLFEQIDSELMRNCRETACTVFTST